ncbi:hypothetical protein D9M73_171440 [compost metagenome]
MRRQQATAGGRHFCRDHRQQPHRGHLVDAVLLTREHHVGNQHAAGQRHRHIQPPQHFGEVNHTVAPARQSEHQEAVDDGCQAHRDGAEEHRDRRVAEDPSCLVEKQQPTRGVQRRKQQEQRDIEQPQGFGKGAQGGHGDRQLRQCQRQHTGAHGGREPVGRELADHLAGMLQMTERFDSGLDAIGACHGELLSSREVESMLDPNRISI